MPHSYVTLLIEQITLRCFARSADCTVVISDWIYRQVCKRTHCKLTAILKLKRHFLLCHRGTPGAKIYISMRPRCVRQGPCHKFKHPFYINDTTLLSQPQCSEPVSVGMHAADSSYTGQPPGMPEAAWRGRSLARTCTQTEV